jgi:transposase
LIRSASSCIIAFMAFVKRRRIWRILPGRQVGVARRTVYHYLKMEQPPERTRLVSRKARPKKIVAYQGYLLGRWNEGCRNARQLHREIVEQGYTASYANVERDLWPVSGQGARWMTLPHDRRLAWQNAYLSRLCQAHPVIARTAELMLSVATMLRERRGEQLLDSWLKQVEEQGVCELRSFAEATQERL